MKYDFTSVMDRAGRDAVAVDIPLDGSENGFFPGAKLREGFDKIPMWVADMNFPTVPTIPEAIIRRAEHPAYGYYRATKEYYDAIINWQRDRNGVEGLEKEHIFYENGVLGGVVSALRALSSPGDPVLLHSPTYVGFTHSLEDNGRRMVLSPLKLDEEGIWRMDYEDMEQKLAKENIHVAVFCSPHNPTGRVWERWEIERAMELFAKYHVYVISDEIWSDLVLDGHKHIPTQSVSEDAKNRTVAIYAPSKTFNLAGLIGSYRIVYEPWLSARVAAEASKSHYNSMNVLSMHALIGGYSPEGQEWVDELCQVLSGNITYAIDFLKEHAPGIKAVRPQGTYMLFLDCTEWCEAHGMTIEELMKAGLELGVMWQDGRPFHGPCHIRMNLALPKSRVEEAFDRLKKYVF